MSLRSPKGSPGSIMNKAEAEQRIRSLCTKWRDAVGLSGAQLEHPSFREFKSWLIANGYSQYLDFQSTMGPDHDAELWFDEEFKQIWRR
jgi:hypothetical protein